MRFVAVHTSKDKNQNSSIATPSTLWFTPLAYPPVNGSQISFAHPEHSPCGIGHSYTSKDNRSNKKIILNPVKINVAVHTSKDNRSNESKELFER